MHHDLTASDLRASDVPVSGDQSARPFTRDHATEAHSAGEDHGTGGSAAETVDAPVDPPLETTRGATATHVRPARPRLDRLPLWKVLLHNDDESDMLFVVDTIVVLRVSNRPDAISRMLEAHETGCALLTTTHREHAELLEEQFRSKGLVVTIEPA